MAFAEGDTHHFVAKKKKIIFSSLNRESFYGWPTCSPGYFDSYDTKANQPKERGECFHKNIGLCQGPLAKAKVWLSLIKVIFCLLFKRPFFVAVWKLIGWDSSVSGWHSFKKMSQRKWIKLGFSFSLFLFEALFLWLSFFSPFVHINRLSLLRHEL